ncbi:NurA domain-containing protein [Caldanaerovirga acetigignens]|uniref:NurA domain-containing protein n=1 Tax=Caldanaerovirga acetigignens TaxID=447595 RepID=A0A1M7GUP8_9FIRM|nr:NurA domain-containing protein [Caldanaerovirga acetigignens]
MEKLNETLKTEFSIAASALKKRIEERPDRESLRNLIEKSGLGRFRISRKMTNDELKSLSEKGGIVGVDGSTNNTAGSFPYVITVQQSLAKSTTVEEEIYCSRVLCPLFMKDEVDEAGYLELVKSSLASLEAMAAIEAIEKLKPAVILVDGSLVRLKIEAKNLWEDLKKEAIDREILLVGVVEGITTKIISNVLREFLPEAVRGACDWELLFGALDVGEGLEVIPTGIKEGFRTVFIRTSIDPKPIGIDLLEEQYEYIKQVENLIFTLTPRDSRGIPLWLDLVDKKVKISDALLEGLLKMYLGEDFSEFLTPKRAKRTP